MPAQSTDATNPQAGRWRRSFYKVAVEGNIAQGFTPTAAEDYDNEPDPTASPLAHQTLARRPGLPVQHRQLQWCRWQLANHLLPGAPAAPRQRLGVALDLGSALHLRGVKPKRRKPALPKRELFSCYTKCVRVVCEPRASASGPLRPFACSENGDAPRYCEAGRLLTRAVHKQRERTWC